MLNSFKEWFFSFTFYFVRHAKYFFQSHVRAVLQLLFENIKINTSFKKYKTYIYITYKNQSFFYVYP